MTLGEKLRKLRKERGWKQQEVADRSGVSRQLISYLEQPRHSGTNPTAKTMLSLANVFDIEVEEFFKAAGYITDVKSTGPRRGRVYKKVEIGGEMSLAEKIKELRTARNWSQDDLAKHSGLDRGYIANLEGTKSIKRPSADAFLKLARALNIKPEELYKAAGYIEDVGDTGPRAETLQELVDKLRITCPQSIPVYAWEAFPFRVGDRVVPIEYVYLRRKDVRGCVEAYIVHGNWVEPKINDGDIIIVDREGVVENGDIVACLVNDEFHVVRVQKVANKLWLEDRYGKYKFEQCRDAAPVIECIRRLK